MIDLCKDLLIIQFHFMKIRLIVAVCIFCMARVSAQTEKMYAVKTGEIPDKVIPAEVIYLLPGFTQGLVFFKNGSSSKQQFNYNSLLDEMHFINAKGDTLAIAEPALIKSVEIDSIKFYYDSGYIQQIYTQGNYKLGVKQKWNQVLDKKSIGYDMGSSSGAIKTYSTIHDTNGSIGKLQVLQDVLYTKGNSFYIGDRFNHFKKANKKNFRSLFEDKNIAQYLKDHKVDFNNEDDLKALLQFCAG